MTLQIRMLSIIVAAIIGLLGVSGYGLYSLRQSMMAERMAQLDKLLSVGLGLVSYYQKQEAAGAMSHDEAQSRAKAAISSYRNGDDYFYVRDTENVMLVHPDPNRVGKFDKGTKTPDGRYTSEIYADLLAKSDRGTFTLFAPKPGVADKSVQYPKLNGAAMFHPWGWIIGTGFFIDDVDAVFWHHAGSFLLIGGLVLLVVAAIVIMMARSVLRQLGGEPEEAARVMRRVATGDLTVTVSDAPQGSMLAALGTMIATLRELIAEIHSSGNRLVIQATHIRDASGQISVAAHQQSEATASIAAAIEQLTVSSDSISHSARDTEHDSRNAMDQANEGSRRVGMATEAIQNVSGTVSQAARLIHALEERAIQVSSIANVIKEIAGQTNLLALNAAIEAARAGDQGRGFAVVADEVRKLAERTATATTEIEQMIGDIQTDTASSVSAMNDVLPKVEEGVRLVRTASESLSAIEAGAKRTLERVVEVADTTREQSVASTDIAQRVEQITQMVDETTVTIGSTANAARELDLIAQTLNARIATFKV